MNQKEQQQKAALILYRSNKKSISNGEKEDQHKKREGLGMDHKQTILLSEKFTQDQSSLVNIEEREFFVLVQTFR